MPLSLASTVRGTSFGQNSLERQTGTLEPVSPLTVPVSTWQEIPAVRSHGFTNQGQTDIFARKMGHAGETIWTAQTGTSGVDSARDVATNASGMFVVGETYGAFVGETNLGSTDIFLVKYDPTGTQSWLRQFGTISTDAGSAVAADESGVYVGGSVAEALPGQQYGVGTANSTPDGFVRKYDSQGSHVWTTQSGLPSSDKVKSLAIDGSDLWISGQIYGAIEGAVNLGGWDAFVSKRDSATGTNLLSWQFGSQSNDEVRSIAVTSSNVVVAGETGHSILTDDNGFLYSFSHTGIEQWRQEIAFYIPHRDYAFSTASDGTGVYVVGSVDGALPNQTITGSNDSYIRKYADDGTTAWTRQFGVSNGDQAVAVTTDDSGVYVAGNVLSFGASFPGVTHFGSQDAYIRKYDTAGNELWTRQAGTADFETLEDIAGNGTIIAIVGTTTGVFPNETSAGSRDVFVQALAQDGTELWTDQFGTSASDEVRGVWIDSTAIYVAGSTTALIGQSAHGNRDMYVRKYSLAGDVQWTLQYGTVDYDELREIDGDGTSIYLVGSTAGEFQGSTNAGSNDAAVLKIGPNGDIQWQRQFGSAELDQATAIDVTAGVVYVFGETAGKFHWRSRCR